VSKFHSWGGDGIAHSSVAPFHGSAGAVLGFAMLLRYGFGEEAAAVAVESAVSRCLAAGVRTRDIATAGEKSIGTREFGRSVLDHLSL
jgi:isocitrate/isopropylmalate dehydrogenase